MSRASWSDLSCFSAALAELYAPATLEAFPDRLLKAMRQLLPGDVCFYNEFGRRHFRVVEEPVVLTQELNDAFVAHMDEHPSARYLTTSGTKEPVMFTDFLSLRQFRETAIYREAFAKIGTDRQLGGVVNSADVTLTYAFNRGGRNYREEDRLLARLLSQHMSHAYRNACLWSARLGGDRGAAAPLLLAVDAEGTVVDQPDAARAVLQRYFPGSRGLPEPLRRWMAVQRQHLRRASHAPLPAQPLRVDSSRGCLTVHYAPAGADGLEYLMLEEKRPPSPRQLEEALGLTLRQAEVLFWIAEGKRNEEIGIILGCTTRTVSKHLEHIFEKLGVETRSAAGAAARRVLR